MISRICQKPPGTREQTELIFLDSHIMLDELVL